MYGGECGTVNGTARGCAELGAGCRAEGVRCGEADIVPRVRAGAFLNEGRSKSRLSSCITCTDDTHCVVCEDDQFAFEGSCV